MANKQLLGNRLFVKSGGKNTPREGEITRVYVLNGDLIFERYNQPNFIYNPFNKLPVGMIFFSVDGDFDPNVELGGVWLMLPDGKYIKSCDNIQTAAGVYLPASVPPILASTIQTGLTYYDPAWGNQYTTGSFHWETTSTGFGGSVATQNPNGTFTFDASRMTDYVNNPYRSYSTAEDGLVDVAHFTSMVWVKQASNEAKQQQIKFILDEWDNQIEKCNKQISQAKAILSTNTQKMSMKKDMTAEEKLALEKENEIQNNIIENRNFYIEKINKKIEIFKKLNSDKNHE